MASRPLLKIVSLVCLASIVIFLLTVLVLKLKSPKTISPNPIDEKAYYQLVTDSDNIPPNSIFTLKILLNSCGGSVCGNITAADIEISYDANNVEPVTSDGSAIANQAEPGSIFTNYFMNSVSPGKIYIAAYNMPPAVFTSVGKTGDAIVYAQIYFRPKIATGKLTFTVNGTNVTTDSTNIYVQGIKSDILNQSLTPANGSLIINVKS